jgi:hypothetical protein
MLERLQRDLGATMHHVGCGEGGLADDIDSIDANKAVFLVGGRGALDVYHVSAPADTFREVLVTHPHLQFAFVIVGFDNDPRGLWEISEARWYVKMFRELVGFDKLEFALDHVASGAAELVNRSPTGQTFHRYVCPERTMPADALAMHGLSAEFLADKPLFGVVADEFLASSAMRCSWPTTRALALPYQC